MGLRTKIFASFAVLLAALLGVVLYVTNTRTESFEVASITNRLELASARFQRRLENQRAATFRLVRAMTADQKYRAFLQRIKENFYSFAEELAMDTDSDFVLMVDENRELRGVSPPDERGVDIMIHTERMSTIAKSPHLAEIFERVLDTGRGVSRVVAFADGLVNANFVPLKESVRDDYALGVILVAKRLGDDTVRDLLGDEVDDLGVVFFVGGEPVASDESPRGRRILAGARSPDGGAVRTVRLRDDRYLVLTHRLADAGAAAGYVVAANLDRALEPIAAMQRTILLIGGLVLLAGLLISLAVAGGIVRPMRRLVEGTQRVVEGDYTFRVGTPTRDEVGELSAAFQKMVEGLKEREEIRGLFGKYVHPSIVSDMLENPEGLGAGGRLRVQSLLFSDVENFVGIGSTMDAAALVGFLNAYLGAMTEELTRSDGILDKYLGDGIMAFFGPPFTPGNHALSACVAALRMRRRADELRPAWAADGLPSIRTRVGIATGEVVVGNIGSEHMRDYTCVGETVNLASRLQDVNKHYGTAIIIDAGTREMAGRAVAVRELDTVRVVGSDHGTRIYELLALAGEAGPRAAEIVERYEAMLGHYRAGRFERAAEGFAALGVAPFHDPPSGVMAARCRDLMARSVDEWDGVHAMVEK